MYLCHDCGWTGNKVELDEGACCPECGCVNVTLADSLDFVPGELDTISSFQDDTNNIEVDKTDEVDDFDLIE